MKLYRIKHSVTGLYLSKSSGLMHRLSKRGKIYKVAIKIKNALPYLEEGKMFNQVSRKYDRVARNEFYLEELKIEQ